MIWFSCMLFIEILPSATACGLVGRHPTEQVGRENEVHETVLSKYLMMQE